LALPVRNKEAGKMRKRKREKKPNGSREGNSRAEGKAVSPAPVREPPGGHERAKSRVIAVWSTDKFSGQDAKNADSKEGRIRGKKKRQSLGMSGGQKKT